MESTVNYHLFYVTKLVSGIELVKENPYFMVWPIIFVFVNCVNNLLVPSDQLVLVDSCMDIETKKSVLKNCLGQEFNQSSFANS